MILSFQFRYQVFMKINNFLLDNTSRDKYISLFLVESSQYTLIELNKPLDGHKAFVTEGLEQNIVEEKKRCAQQS